MKRFKPRVVALYGATIFFSAGAFGGRVLAAGTASSITTSPVFTSLVAPPGKSVSTTMQVENNGPRPVQLAVQLRTFVAGGTNGQAAIETPSSSDASIGWVHFSQTSFTAAPGAWTPIVMTINLPKNAALGYYYAVLFKPVTPDASTLQKGVNIVTGSNVVLVLLNAKSPNEQERLKIDSFHATKSLYEYLPANFDFTVRNTGNIYFPPHGDIYISRDKNSRGVIDTIPVNTPEGNVLPGSERTFQANWTDGFPVFLPKTLAGQPLTDTKNHPLEQLRWDFSNLGKFRFGKYYARLALVYNNGQRDVLVDQTIAFWVIPWKLLFVLLLLVLLLLGGVFGFGRFVYRRVHRITRRR